MVNPIQLVLVGGGGTAADVLALIQAINRTGQRYQVLGLVDDSASAGSSRLGVPVLGRLTDAARYEEAWFVDCLGSPRSYGQRQELLFARGIDAARFETIVHPTVFIAADARIGPGCILYPNVVLLSGVTLGEHVTVLANSVLNHNASVGAYSILASGVNVSGSVSIGPTAYIGCGASLREGISVGRGAMVGLGSAVVADVHSGTVVAGNPARPLPTGR